MGGGSGARWSVGRRGKERPPVTGERDRERESMVGEGMSPGETLGCAGLKATMCAFLFYHFCYLKINDKYVYRKMIHVRKSTTGFLILL